MADKPDFEMLFLKTYIALLDSRNWLRYDTPEYDDANDFLEAYKATFQAATEVKLAYGECPVCGESCQPESSGYDDNVEEVCCKDCGIMWLILHTEETENAETWEDVFQIADVELM